MRLLPLRRPLRRRLVARRPVARRLGWILPLSLAAVMVLAALSRHRSAAAPAPRPSTIARGIPGDAVVYLEAEQLRRALELWQSSGLRARFHDSAADREMRKGMLYLRLAERFAALEQIAGFELTMPRLLALTGDRAGLAVYDLGETEFVFEAELASAALAKTPLAQAKQRFATRRYAGVDYFVKSAKHGSRESALAFAFLGDRLLVSNSVTRFHEALLLVAREERVKTDGTRPGDSMADDERFTRLMAAAPSGKDALARVFVRAGALRGSHYFDDFWVFGGDSPALDGIAASLLTLAARGDRLRETRVHAYDDDVDPPAAANVTALPAPGGEAGRVGEIDTDRVATPLPAFGLAVQVAEGGAAAAGTAIARLLPAMELDEGEPDDRTPPDVASDVAAVLQAAEAGRLLEVTDVATDTRPLTARPGLPLVRRSGAVAIRLAQAVDSAGLEKALVAHLNAVVGRGAALAFADAAGGTRTLTVPLVSGWALALLTRDNGRLVIVATDPGLARRIAAELDGASGIGTLLADDAPLVARLDVAAAAGQWATLANALAARQNWLDSTDASWAQLTAPSLFAAAAIATITTVGYRADELYVEQVDYAW